MIEQAMIFALGFLLAGLLALALVPAFWRRAIALTRRRLEAQVPVSVHEILAERDQLRAQNAVECRRLEDKAAALNRLHAADLSELGRRAAKIVALEAEKAAIVEESKVPVTENLQLQRELAEVRAEAAAADKALFDAELIYGRQRDEIRDRNETLSSLSALSEVRLTSLTASENYAKGLERQIAALRAELAGVQNRASEKTRAVSELGEALMAARSELAKIQRKLDVETARAADLEANVSALRAERTADAARMRGSESRFTEETQLLRSSSSALQDAVAAARHRSEELESQLTAMQRAEAARPAATVHSNENAILRQSISDIATAIITLTQKAPEPNSRAAAASAPLETPKMETNGAGPKTIAKVEPVRDLGLASRSMPETKSGEGRDKADIPIEIRSPIEIQ
jgi:chromosome segregation ATPase